MTDNINNLLEKAYKFYLHYFALYIKSNEIPVEDWEYHKRLTKKLAEERKKIETENGLR